MCKSLVVNVKKLSGCENLLGCSMETQGKCARQLPSSDEVTAAELFPAFARKERSLDGKMTLLDCSLYKAYIRKSSFPSNQFTRPNPQHDPIRDTATLHSSPSSSSTPGQHTSWQLVASPALALLFVIHGMLTRGKNVATSSVSLDSIGQSTENWTRSQVV